MFRASSCPSSGATTTAVAASVLLSVLGAVGRGRAGCQPVSARRLDAVLTAAQVEVLVALLLHVSATVANIRQTFQYTDMTCSVPQCRTPYCLHLLCRILGIWIKILFEI
jgi:hypothetical protein